MKKNVLVTLANKNYIKQAKQLFSSVYWNAGWDGDYLLLAHEIPEKNLIWFREKGILVKKCKSLYKKSVLANMGLTRYEWVNIVLTKFNLFTRYFKQWKNVIFLDADILVRASLDRLTRINGFAAVEDIFTLRWQCRHNSEKEKDLITELSKKYKLENKSFNTGVLAYSTDIIKKDTAHKIKKIFKKFGKISKYGDQGILNLFFYKKWKEIPAAYNTQIISPVTVTNLEKKRIEAIVIHSITREKMWDRTFPLYKEWCVNLKKVDFINIKKPIPPKKIWTDTEITLQDLYVKLRRSIYKQSWTMEALRKSFNSLITVENEQRESLDILISFAKMQIEELRLCLKKIEQLKCYPKKEKY